MKPHRIAAREQQGYVLMLVLALLALASFVALRFAERNDALRSSVLGFTEYAEAQRKASGALARTQYWLATRPLHPMGRGEAPQVLRMDGRWHVLPDGSWVAVQDHRGLLSVNALIRDDLLRLLVREGLEPQRAQAWLDVLQDYQDPDSLHRVNGAEREHYEQLSLPAPRNDWLFSLRELNLMPLWRDEPALVERLQRLMHTAINNQFNPNTAPEAVLQARLPELGDAQYASLLALRRADALEDVRRLPAQLGLRVDEDSTLLVPGFSSRITVWAPGMPMAHDYNFRVTPAGEGGPWTVLEQQPAPRPPPLDERNRAAYPLLSNQAPRASASAASA